MGLLTHDLVTLMYSDLHFICHQHWTTSYSQAAFITITVVVLVSCLLSFTGDSACLFCDCVSYRLGSDAWCLVHWDHQLHTLVGSLQLAILDFGQATACTEHGTALTEWVLIRFSACCLFCASCCLCCRVCVYSVSLQHRGTYVWVCVPYHLSFWLLGLCSDIGIHLPLCW